MMPSLPLVLVPGLTCSARLYAPQITALWPLAPIMVANHRRDSDIASVAARILAEAPPRFALAGLSMGGYIAFEMLRQAAGRIARLALLDTSARADTPEQTATRKEQIAMAQAGRYAEIPELGIKRYLHVDHQEDEVLKTIVRQMAQETGAEAFVRQQHAILSRPDSRPLLGSITCPTLVLVGDGDLATPPELNEEIAEGITGAKFTVVSDCGHLSTIEAPEPVNAALAEWLTA
jgi:pimeloyl-ACP methyl ester carboxylesterase